MISVEEQAAIRQAYYVEAKSIREIAQELHCARRTVRKALASAEPQRYTLHAPRAAPVLGPYQARIAALVADNAQLPRKQRYTSHKIFTLLRAEGYRGAESTVRGYISALRCRPQHPAVYLPLEFTPGQDAQVDWGEARVYLAGELTPVQLFVMRLCYSRRLFLRAYPCQQQEAFLDGHVAAFAHFQGVPHRIAYDNLKTAVYRVLTGPHREEQARLVVFRSHYLYESRYCTPGEGHEKGGVEHAVGFGRRNFLTPPPQVASYAELNILLVQACLADDARQVDRQPQTIGAAWEAERPHLRPLPAQPFDCARVVEVVLNPYSQVVFETNRYSVPTDRAQRQLVLKAYPFEIVILHQHEVLARHPRCYGREQDILEPLHYLPLLLQRPGAFEHAQPLRRWRAQWPPVYEQLLTRLQAAAPDGAGVREFIQVLQLHHSTSVAWLTQAITTALTYPRVSYDHVVLCLRQLQQPAVPTTPAVLTAHPELAAVAAQPPDLQTYDQLLGR